MPTNPSGGDARDKNAPNFPGSRTGSSVFWEQNDALPSAENTAQEHARTCIPDRRDPIAPLSSIEFSLGRCLERDGYLWQGGNTLSYPHRRRSPPGSASGNLRLMVGQSANNRDTLRFTWTATIDAILEKGRSGDDSPAMPAPAKAEPSSSRGALSAGLPLSTLLSQVLVAFTIEFDNESERQIPHRTTKHGATAGSLHAPWLVSLVMWSNCMRFVGDQGLRVAALEGLARTTTNLNGMERWGYVVVRPDPADSRSKPPRSDWVIRATPAGRKAQGIWRPLFAAIEKRWQARFGKEEIDRLGESLGALSSQIDVELPDCLPILGYGRFSRALHQKPRGPAGGEDGIASRLPLSALLSRVLVAFAIEFEGESDLSLAISANLVRVRDLPLLTGVSKEAISMAMGVLRKKGIAVVETDPAGSRGKVARLTPKGRDAQDTYRQLAGIIEERWRARFGLLIIRTLRASLERLVGEPSPQLSPLFRGLDPHPDGWRASVAKPNTLPHYPMVLHRGGFPDGS
jgi:DNA-binding MarR family transcriptional regulator